jgi:hypothetical protein
VKENGKKRIEAAETRFLISVVEKSQRRHIGINDIIQHMQIINIDDKISDCRQKRGDRPEGIRVGYRKKRWIDQK